MIDMWHAERTIIKIKNIISPRKYPGQYLLAQARWKFIKQRIPHESLTILDVGSGYGFMGMVVAKDKDVNLVKYIAVDTDTDLQASLEMTWQKYFPTIEIQTLNSVEDVTDKCDLAVMSHILEHIPDLRGMVSASLSKLRQDGFMFVDVPNQEYLFKQEPSHMRFFTPSNLKELLKTFNLTLISIICCGHHRDKAPFNDKNKNDLKNKLAAVVHKFRRLSTTLSMLFFSWYLGVDVVNTEGTWIRALAQKNNHRSLDRKTSKVR